MDSKAKLEFSKGRERAPWAEGQCPQDLSSQNNGGMREGASSPRGLRRRRALFPGHTGCCGLIRICCTWSDSGPWPKCGQQALPCSDSLAPSHLKVHHYPRFSDSAHSQGVALPLGYRLSPSGFLLLTHNPMAPLKASGSA